jgi:hypothetical protein
MLFMLVFAAFATIPAVNAQDSTGSATRCTTRFGYYPLPTGTAAVPTWYRYTTSTITFSSTYETHETVTIAPSVTTTTDVITTTLTFSTTTTSTQVPTTVPTPAGFIPLLYADLASPTPVPRFKRYELGGREAATALHLLKRQTIANHTSGFSVDRNGTSTNLYRKYAQRVDCRVFYTISTSIAITVTGLPETVTIGGQTATALVTNTVLSTTTVTEVVPRSTVYAACQRNNVGMYAPDEALSKPSEEMLIRTVNSVTGMTGNTLVFDRVLYRPAQGFPIENELIVNTTSAENCCVACQNTVSPPVLAHLLFLDYSANSVRPTAQDPSSSPANESATSASLKPRRYHPRSPQHSHPPSHTLFLMTRIAHWYTTTATTTQI